MNLYYYDGPVMEFDRCIAERWQASTYAASKTKARNNLMYRYKKLNNKTVTVKITLPGKIIEA